MLTMFRSMYLARRFGDGEILGLSTIDPPDEDELDAMGIDRDEWVRGHTPDTFDPDLHTKYERLHPNHAFIVTEVDGDAGTVTVVNPWDPTAGEVVLTESQLRESVNGVRTNEAQP